jgi:Flp pilus assembly protein TadG
MKIKTLPNLNMRSPRVQKAQGMLEFALVIPVLLLLVFGIIEFGRLMFIYASVASSSREAVRYGSAVDQTSGVPRYIDCAGIRDAAKRIGDFAGVQDAGITIKYDDGAVDIAASCAGVTDPSIIKLGDRIVVSVTANYTPMVLLANIAPFPITSTSARTIIKRVGVAGTPAPTPTALPFCDMEFNTFSTVGSTATWTFTNLGDTDTIRSIKILFPSLDNGNMTLIKYNGPDLWTGSNGSPPVTLGISDFSGISREFASGTTANLSFKFTSASVWSIQNKYDLLIDFEHCDNLDDPPGLPSP